MNFCADPKAAVFAVHNAKLESGDVFKLYEENWKQRLPGTPSPVGHSNRVFSDLSSTLFPESAVSTISSLDSLIGSVGFHVACPGVRKVNRITQLASSSDCVPAFGGSCRFDSPLPGSSVTKPVPIPNKRGGQATIGTPELADLHNSGIAGAHINDIGEDAVPVTGQDLGSWTKRQIKYPIKKEADIIESPRNGLPKYGFMPAEVAAKAAAPSPTPAFWPEGSQQRKGPHRAAMAEAARAAAVKPTQRVLFRAACRVDAPQRPGLDKPVQPILGRRRAPAKKEDPEVDVEDKLWRLRSKRAWIREQLRALRGFPKDSAYDEPWSEAFEMVQAMGEGLNLQTGLPGDFSDAEEDGFSSDSDYHEQLLFDEEPIKAHPIPGAAANPGPATSGSLPHGSPSTASPRSVLSTALPTQGAHAPNATETASKISVLTSTFQSLGLHNGGNKPTTVVGCAQELIRHQRSIEVDAERAWQARFAGHKTVLKGGSPASAGKVAGPHRLLLRNDSAYEAPCKEFTRAAIKLGQPLVF
ncbi:hypothetical protein COCOBI_13-1290 [Coccomyxa sp. Obi]|nr:hypothetical protein COCOBI_13-1290 [Coccomyxa sp. Obi]